jgi:glycerol kinase
MTYYMAIDQGSHASRACLFDESGELICKHTKKIKTRHISNSHIEQDANEIVDSVKEVVARLLDESSTQQTIVACGIATQRSSVVAWNKNGTAISPVLSWQDTRGKQLLAKLKKNEAEIQQLSGLPLSAHYGASKLNYLLAKAKHNGTTLDSLRLSPLISYLLFHILDEHPYIVDHANAQRTQLFDLNKLNWSTRLTKLFNIPKHLLPDCVAVLKTPDSPHGKLATTDIPVCAINGDQNAAIFGSGLLTPETALVNFGTGAFVLRLLRHYSASKKQLSGIACSDHNSVQYIREATINGAGSALSWLEKKHQVNDILKQLPAWLNEGSLNEASLNKTELNKIRQPPVFINTIGGLGSPWWLNNIDAKFIESEFTEFDRLLNNVKTNIAANIATADLATEAVAIIESIVFMVCINLQIMQSEHTITRIRVSGGLSQLDGLCQRLTNLSALRVERMKLPETTARGVAWLAGGKPDGWSNVELDVFKPVINPDLTKRYAMFSTILEY